MVRERTLAGGLGAIAALALLGCLALGGCVPATPEPAPPAPPPPAPPPVAAPLPAPTYQSWMDVPATPGDWRYRAMPGGTRASFGTGGTPLFEMACEPPGRIVLIRAGAGVGGGGASSAGTTMEVLTETASRALPAASAEGGVSAQVSARDPLLDAMAFSKGRFAIRTAGLPTLYLPAWPEVTRVIEDCR